MTDKLTPGQLRDLAELCAVGNRVVTLTANGETTRFYPNKDLSYVLLEEAARREAEQLDPVGTASLAQSKDKSAPAADDLPDRLRTAFLSALEIERIRKEAADRIEAQAREIAATNDHLDIAQATCNMQIERADRAEAENARLHEVLTVAHRALSHPRDGWFDNVCNEALTVVSKALAHGGEHG